MKNIKKHFKGFTLVELIIVITILVILGTIAFISFQNYTKDTRDSVRLVDIKQIYNGLDIERVKTEKTPLPEKYIEVTNGTKILTYQGYAGKTILRQIKINNGGQDPVTEGYYIYTTDSKNKKIQLMTYLETSNKEVKILGKLEEIIPKTNAITSSGYYQDKKIYIYGDKIGTVTDKNKVPLQEITTNSGYNLLDNNKELKTYFGGEVYENGQSSNTGTTLVNQIEGAINGTIPCNPTSYSGYAITSLQDNQSQMFTKTGSVLNGKQTLSIQATCNNGILSYLNEVTNITCSSGYVLQGGVCIPDVCQGTAPTNSTSTSTSQTITKSWAYNTTPGICTFVCNTNYTYNSGTNICDANTQTNQTCVGLPSNAVWNSVSAISQIWNGSSWIPSTNGTYNMTSSTTNCNYECNTNYHTEDDGVSCVNNTRNCGITNGQGSQTWNNGTSSWGTCVAVSCNSGYYVSGNSCTPNNCTLSTQVINLHSYSVPAFNHGATTTQTSVNGISNGTKTYQQTFTCNLGIVSTSGSESSIAINCNSGYHTEDGGVSCVSNTRNCGITNGQGSQTWNNGTSSWGACTVISCNYGYVVDGNNCKSNMINITYSSSDSLGHNIYNDAKNPTYANPVWNGTSANIFNVVVGTGVTLTGPDQSSYAMTVPAGFPSGSSIKITNYGNINGVGGLKAWRPGGNGGPSVLISTATSIINYGNINGGGGGGGGYGGAGGLGANAITINAAGTSITNRGYITGGGGGGGGGGASGGGTGGAGIFVSASTTIDNIGGFINGGGGGGGSCSGNAAGAGGGAGGLGGPGGGGGGNGNNGYQLGSAGGTGGGGGAGNNGGNGASGSNGSGGGGGTADVGAAGGGGNMTTSGGGNGGGGWGSTGKYCSGILSNGGKSISGVSNVSNFGSIGGTLNGATN